MKTYYRITYTFDNQTYHSLASRTSKNMEQLWAVMQERPESFNADLFKITHTRGQEQWEKLDSINRYPKKEFGFRV